MTLGGRITRIEDYLAGRGNGSRDKRYWSAFWEQHLPKLTDEQLDRLETLVLMIDERTGADAPNVGRELLPDAEREEFLALFAVMGVDLGGQS